MARLTRRFGVGPQLGHLEDLGQSGGAETRFLLLQGIETYTVNIGCLTVAPAHLRHQLSSSSLSPIRRDSFDLPISSSTAFSPADPPHSTSSHRPVPDRKGCRLQFLVPRASCPSVSVPPCARRPSPVDGLIRPPELTGAGGVR